MRFIYILLGLIILATITLVVKTLLRKQVTKNKSIKKCFSPSDIQYVKSQKTQSIIKNIEDNKSIIKEASLSADKEISTAWLKSYKNVMRISETLDQNLKYYSNKRLENSKFQYYTSLHFRSMIAADITYKEYKAVDSSFNAINNYIESVSKNGGKTNISKSKLDDTKNSLKELRDTLLNRVHEMNRRTGELRDKIGLECGERGKIWLRELTKRKNSKKLNH